MAPGGVRRWWPWLAISLATAAAHLWCLGSQFYLDDLWQIRDNLWILEGRPLEPMFLQWTYLMHCAQHALWGMSPVGFHFVNWALHAGVAVALYAVGLRLFGDHASRGAVLFGALVFAVHPLGSEIPNYARTQDLAWVVLWSLLACWFLLRWVQGGRWGWGVAMVAAILGATFSKGPGFFHAVSMTGVVAVAALRPRHLGFLRRHWRWAALLGGAAFLVLLAILWGTGSIDGWRRASSRWAHPRFVGHGFSICRVFWLFVRRSFWPSGLSADHHIAETLVSEDGEVADTGAVWAAVGMAAWVLGSVALLWKPATRPFGACALLFVAAMVLRLLYMVGELMPEYRIYPGLPWFCLGAGVLLARGWTRWISPRPWLPAVLVLCLLAVFSARRAFLWHDLDRLMADVLGQYPGQGRAIWVLQRKDVEEGNWQAVIDRQEKAWPEVARAYHALNREALPERTYWTGRHALSEVGSGGLYARALAHARGPEAGLESLRSLEAWMGRLGMKPETHHIHFIYLRHAEGKVKELAGDYQGAVEAYRATVPVHDRLTDLRRAQARLRAAKAGAGAAP